MCPPGWRATGGNKEMGWCRMGSRWIVSAEISRARANGRVYKTRAESSFREATKSRLAERSKVRKGKAINFYDRELSRAFRGSHPLGSRKIARLAQGAQRGHNFRNRVNRQRVTRGRSLLTRKERQMLSSVLLLHRK